MNTPKPASWRSRAVIVVIALLTLGPMLLAWYYASHPELISQRSNYGQLLTPIQTLDYTQLAALPSSPVSLDDLKGRWVLVQLGTEGCGAACNETRHKTHQSRLMMNKEISRIRRLLLLPEQASGWQPPAEFLEDESLVLARANPLAWQKMREALGTATPLESALLLMDPQGNLVLYYPPGFDPYGLVKDLKHLLKVSQIG